MATFPDARLKQTYGLIELGVFPTQSKGQDSTFFKIKDSFVKHRVRSGMLEIKSPFTMLGYLNAPTPFSDDGWYMTGDKVLVEDGFMTVQGRVSDIINVGGEKVFPQEVESVLIDVEGVDDARVFGEANFLLGKIVCADVQVSPNADVVELESQIKCQVAEVLEPFKIPIKINFKTEALVNDRLKKSRRN
jgi:non-ribosomal peptide synthetase component E (peptide arylation enzyme)